jgi:hypothetical protein
MRETCEIPKPFGRRLSKKITKAKTNMEGFFNICANVRKTVKEKKYLE